MNVIVTEIHDHHRSLLNQHLHQFLGDLDPDALALLHERFEWVEVTGGETLIEQGAPGDSMYLSVSGRLRAYVNDEHGKPSPVREMGRGQAFGEMSLYTDEPRSATVVAIRDSLLVRLNKAHFSDLLASNHQLSMALTRQIIHRLQTQHDLNPMPLPVTITLVLITEGIDRLDFAERLSAQLRHQGSVSIIDSRTVYNELDTSDDGAVSNDEAQLNRHMAIYLDNIESKSDFVLLVADDTPKDWTQRCCRHGDELLLLADIRQEPTLHVTETDYLNQQSRRTEAAEILVLLHPADTRCPVGTRAWLERRPVTNHVHIRPELEPAA